MFGEHTLPPVVYIHVAGVTSFRNSNLNHEFTASLSPLARLFQISRVSLSLLRFYPPFSLSLSLPLAPCSLFLDGPENIASRTDGEV